MKLSGLLEKLKYECLQGSVQTEVKSLVYDSRKIEKDCLFVCIIGANFDGHTFAQEAADKGASVLVVSEELENLPEGVTVIRVEDTRYALAFLSAAWFGHPAEKLKTIGITGTKGKTTTTYLVKSILEHAGFQVGLVGTIETIIGEKISRQPIPHRNPIVYRNPLRKWCRLGWIPLSWRFPLRR